MTGAASTTVTEGQLGQARRDIIDAAAGLVQAQVLSPSQHGNISVRIPGADVIMLTSVSSLADVTREGLAALDLDGNVIEGQIAPTSAEIIKMHTEVYRKRADVGGVIHTHSPFATTFAVANKPLALVSEALVRFGIEEPIPVAAYAPRGSRESVSNIVDVVGPKTKAVLLQNHGLLAFAETVAAAKHLVLVIEEAAQAAILASALGGATVIPAAMMHYTRQRAEEYATRGALTADRPAD
ncbi:MAG TPA: class II aldolase/adducin family protein [Thermomicrobiales bacterium]|nr:class II aldolase/adducin family protein [Thermomicrobiales bacterium]